MKKKIICIFICMLLINTIIIFLPRDINVMAEDTSEDEYIDIGIDDEYIWRILGDLCNVTYDAYDENDIPKGRSFGSKGEHYTVDKILFPEMQDHIGLEDVNQEQIKHIDGIDTKYYTTIINMTDFQLIINNASDTPYPYNKYMPKEEMFVLPCGFPPEGTEELTANFTFSDADIIPKNMTEIWPFAGSFNDYHFNSTDVECLRCVSPIIVGNVTYLNPEDSIPSLEEQYGRVYLLEDTSSSQEKLDNINRAMASIVIDSGARGIEYVDTSECANSVVSINESDSDILKGLLENCTVLVDNVTGNLTFTYNLNEGWWPSSDFIFIDRLPDHYELWDMTDGLIKLVALTNGHDKPNIADYIICFMFKSAYCRWLNDIRPYKNFGIFIYDSYDYHFMLSPMHFWDTEPPSFFDGQLEDYFFAYFGLGNTGAIPIFTMNYSVGNFLNVNKDDTTVTGYANQVYQEETPENPGVEAYNVIGNITIENSPDNAIAIISNRYDGMWGQTPGDSGVGTAIVLGIAKYFKDYNILPKYDLTFLFTTAEEYGCRGMYHYNDSHQNDNIKYWFILDQ